MIFKDRKYNISEKNYFSEIENYFSKCLQYSKYITALTYFGIYSFGKTPLDTCRFHDHTK
jgi:hypothetical protein